jgi:DNA mismatch repair protein MutL
MSDIIQLLPDNVANQIAAGEVIQRPASVVKELMENAIDAGSTRVKVILKDAGKTLIQLIDNGCGMSVTDARMSFERHATSKIRNVNDLFAIRTMGFRGEALASVAAIAHVNLKTRRVEDELGTELVINGTEVTKQEPASCPSGCNFSIKNLFFNVPARRKFLKKDATELKHAINEFQRVSLANPDVEFSLHNNDTEIYNLPVSNLKQRIINLFGKNINQSLINISSKTSLAGISGFITKPESARKTTGEQFFFINNRYMRHPYLHKALTNAYDQLIAPDEIPGYFIFFDADPSTIDINIHPTKTEIKFEDERSIWQLLHAAVKQSLGTSNMMPSIDFDASGKITIPIIRKGNDVKAPKININPEYNPFENETGNSGYQYRRENTSGWEQLYGEPHRKDEQQTQKTVFPGSTNSDMSGQAETPRFTQLKNKYITTQVKSGLMIIDQHRAHERILFEKYMQRIKGATGVSQKSMFPQTIELNPADFALVGQLKEELQALGFDIGEFGGNSVVINGLPSDAGAREPQEMLELFIEQIKSTDGDIRKNSKEKIALALASASAVRSGTSLNQQEMQTLFNQLFACENHGYSPSGKIIVSILSIDEIEKRF